MLTEEGWPWRRGGARWGSICIKQVLCRLDHLSFLKYFWKIIFFYLNKI